MILPKYPGKSFGLNMGIQHSTFDAFVSQEFLYLAYAGAVVQRLNAVSNEYTVPVY